MPDQDLLIQNPGAVTVDASASAKRVLGAVPDEVVRMLRVGFEMRLTVRPVTQPHLSTVADGATTADVTVVLTRSHARELGLEVGARVWLAPNRGATSVPTMGERADAV